MIPGGTTAEVQEYIRNLPVSETTKRRVEVYLSLAYLGLSLEEIRYLARDDFMKMREYGEPPA